MILYWRVGDNKETLSSENNQQIDRRSKESLIPGLLDITALNPKDVDWVNSLGQNKLYVNIPIEVRERIKIALTKCIDSL